ncbi:hypothetical protein M8J77_018977 [Diaphorina citri]|nr:hypothetical protein M8J77_018977 [Diaphorina citri]
MDHARPVQLRRLLGSLDPWWAIAAEEREWKYRLSIYYVKLLDSGTFTCTTPRGLSNSVNVNIKAVHCDRLSLRSHERLSTKIDGHRLGQMAHFTCPAGTIREGPANITCMANVEKMLFILCCTTLTLVILGVRESGSSRWYRGVLHRAMVLL